MEPHGKTEPHDRAAVTEQPCGKETDMAKRTATPKIEQLTLCFPHSGNGAAEPAATAVAKPATKSAEPAANSAESPAPPPSANADGAWFPPLPACTCRDPVADPVADPISDPISDPVALAREGLIFDLLALYLERCASPGGVLPIGSRSVGESRAVRQETEKPGKNAPPRRLPNLAGFCRFLGVGTAQMERLSDEEPETYDTLCAVFEDEALNSGVSASVLTPYFKRRLGYGERVASPPAGGYDDGTVKLVFDHDIWEDGA